MVMHSGSVLTPLGMEVLGFLKDQQIADCAFTVLISGVVVL